MNDDLETRLQSSFRRAVLPAALGVFGEKPIELGLGTGLRGGHVDARNAAFAHRQATIDKGGLGDFARTACNQRGDRVNRRCHDGIIQPKYRDISAGTGFQAAKVGAAQRAGAAQCGGIPKIGALLVGGLRISDAGGHQAGEQVQQHICGGGIGAHRDVDTAPRKVPKLRRMEPPAATSGNAPR